jgi:hypothetical protein
VTILLFASTIFNPLTAASFASNQISIEGNYLKSLRQFTGTVSFEIELLNRNLLYFHLPPNWNSKPDCRETFLLPTKDLTPKAFSRAELDELKQYDPQNLQLAKSIRILGVTIEHQPATFYLTDNPALLPGKAVKNALLVVNTSKVPSDKNVVGISIMFQTEFQKLPEGYTTILWDYSPRPVLTIGDRPDFADFYTKPYTFRTDLTVSNTSTDVNLVNFYNVSNDTIPVFIFDGSNYEGDNYIFTPDRYLKNEAKTIQERIKRVQSFLFSQGWLNRAGNSRHYVIWDGSLTVTGDHVFLPRKLFRYHPIYYKTFEIALVKASIEASIRNKFIFSSTIKPWLLPTLYGEVVRSYFQVVYGSDTRYFPWGRWLNPEFYEENSIKRWISYPEEYFLVSANEPLPLNLISSVYNPWQEKGFHLLRTVVGPNTLFTENIFPALKRIFNETLTKPTELNEDLLFDTLGFTEHQRNQTVFWLSRAGSVDFEVSAVAVQKESSWFIIDIDILNHGSLSPSFDLLFLMEDGLEYREEVAGGAGRYRFIMSSQPNEIEIDPDRKLLENNLLNNSWHLPYKIRPIWDFPSPENVIITISPVINGNTFDRNLFGISLGLSYLNQTSFTIAAWRGDGDEKVLWESSIIHSGKPWPGSEIFFNSSELNASHAISLGFKHRFIELDKNLWFLASLTEEDLDNLENSELSADQNKWQSIHTQVSFPLYKGNFSDSQLELTLNYGRNYYDERYDFYQQSLKNLSIGYLGYAKTILMLSVDYSHGFVPLQKRYPMGGPEGLPGFPRETDLLFEQRRIIGLGLTASPFLTHSNIHLLHLGWLDRMESTLILHWGQGYDNQSSRIEHFQDVELKFSGFAEWLNMYRGEGVLSVAKPIGHQKYKDYRIILFSSWTF